MMDGAAAADEAAQMMRRRKPDKATATARSVDDRAWSSRSNLHERDVGKDIVRYTPLPAETGPTWAPDQLSIWPVEGGRYGIDAHYHGETGAQRAEHQVARLAEAGLVASVRPGPEGARRSGSARSLTRPRGWRSRPSSAARSTCRADGARAYLPPPLSETWAAAPPPASVSVARAVPRLRGRKRT